MDLETDKERTEETSKLNPQHRQELHRLRNDVHRYLKDRDQYDRCEIEVKKRGAWYEFEGHVGSPGIKLVLFGMVPKHGGAQRIVDRVRVDSGAS